MKKLGKIVLSITLVAAICVFAFAFTACNNATTEGQLEDVWFSVLDKGTENYSYAVTNSATGATGVYDVSIKFCAAGAETVVSEFNTVKGTSKGYLITCNLSMSDGYVSDARCFFRVASVVNAASYFLRPIASYKSVSGASENYVTYGEYTTSSYNYTLVKDGQTETGSIDVGSKFYDNNEFHQVLRSVAERIFASGFSLSYSVALPTEKLAAGLTAATVAKEDVQTEIVVEDAKVSYSCYKVNVSRDTKVEGINQSLWYAVNDTGNAITTNGFTLNHVLVKIVEPTDGGDVTYILKSYSIND